MREGFLKVFMMDRYILNKCEDMVFDTLTHKEIFPDKICLLLNAKPMEVQKLEATVSRLLDMNIKLSKQLTEIKNKQTL